MDSPCESLVEDLGAPLEEWRDHSGIEVGSYAGLGNSGQRTISDDEQIGPSLMTSGRRSFISAKVAVARERDRGVALGVESLAHLVVAELLVIIIILLQEGVELDDVGVLQQTLSAECKR